MKATGIEPKPNGTHARCYSKTKIAPFITGYPNFGSKTFSRGPNLFILFLFSNPWASYSRSNFRYKGRTRNLWEIRQH